MLRLFYQPFTLVMVVLEFVLFRADSIPSAGHYLSAMFGAGPLLDGPAVFWCREMAVPFVCAVLGCVPWWRRLTHPAAFAVACGAQFLLLLVSVSCLVMKAHNPFIYFNF